MRITLREPDRMVIEDAAAVPRTCGALGAVLGLGFIAYSFAAHAVRHALNWQLAGGAMLIVGAGVLLLLPASRIFIDRRMGIARIRRRTLLGDERGQLVQLSDVTSVDVQEIYSARSGATFQVVFRTTSGATVPWTSYFANGRREAERIADEVAAFLGKGESTSATI